MDRSLELVHRRNQLMIVLLFGFYLFSLVVNVFVLGASALYPPIGLVLCAVVGFYIYKKKFIRLTMHAIVWLIFIYFFYLISFYPYLVNYIFMWFGLVLSSLYQNYRIIIEAGIFSISLTVYSFFTLHEEIFPGVVTSDIIYLIIFGIFMTVFLILYSRFTSNLWVKAQQNEEKLKNILQSANIMTFSYDVTSGKRRVTSQMKTPLPVKPDCSSGSPLICCESIHSEDLEEVKAAEKEILQGVEKSIEYRLVLPDNSLLWLRGQFLPIFDENQKLKSIEGIVVDITEEKNYEARMRYLAYHDQLTGLPNRTLLNDYFREAVANQDFVDKGLYVIFIDLDSFKEINDTYGHEFGDRLLVVVSMRILSSIRETDMLSRIGGDEFVGILVGVSEEEAERIAIRIKNALSAPIFINDFEMTVTPSIGISTYDRENGDSLDELIREADMAMYRVKNEGKNAFRFY